MWKVVRNSYLQFPEIPDMCVALDDVLVRNTVFAVDEAVELDPVDILPPPPAPTPPVPAAVAPPNPAAVPEVTAPDGRCGIWAAARRNADIR